MSNYSFLEMADMHFMYGKANGSAREARRIYEEAFPDRRIPCEKTFIHLHQRLRENGSFVADRSNCGRNRTTRTPEAEERVLEEVAANPGSSTRRIALQENVPKSIVCEILHEQLLHPYHLQRVQPLKPQDLQPRVQFCEWMQRKCRQNRSFLRRVLFTDEAGFTRDGIINFHNTHVWADENPHAIFESRFQDKFSINVWAGVIGDRLIGPYVLPQRINGQTYLAFLQNVLPELLDDVPYGDRLEMWYMHDGAPPHYSISVRDYLNQMYPDRWIGRGGPTPWPPRSPDLNPLDYFLWGYLKALVYSEPIISVEQLEQRVLEKCQYIRNKQGIFARVRTSMINRLNSCIDMGGSHFQHLI